MVDFVIDIQKMFPSLILSTILAPQKPTRRVPQEDQLQQYETLDNISNFSDVDESLLNTLGNGFTFVRHEDHVLFIKYQQATY